MRRKEAHGEDSFHSSDHGGDRRGALALSGCTAGDGEDDGANGEAITFWVQEDLPDRVAATEEIVAAFEEESGVDVEVASVAEDQFAQLITRRRRRATCPTSSAASRFRRSGRSASDLIDANAVGDVIEALDSSTFSAEALELTADGDTQLAVPSESWTQMLFYRADLFDAARSGCARLVREGPGGGRGLNSSEIAGFVGATAPGDAFTEQTFEQVALGNDCQLVDDEGEIQLGLQRHFVALLYTPSRDTTSKLDLAQKAKSESLNL